MKTEEDSKIKFPIIRAFHPKEDPLKTRQFSRRSKSELLKDFLNKDAVSKKTDLLKGLGKPFDFVSSFQVSPPRQRVREEHLKQEVAAQQVGQNMEENIERKFVHTQQILSNGRKLRSFNFLEKFDKIKAIIKASPHLGSLSTEKSEKKFIPFRLKGKKKNENDDYAKVEVENNFTETSRQRDEAGNLNAFLTDFNLPLIDKILNKEKSKNAQLRSLSLGCRPHENSSSRLLENSSSRPHENSGTRPHENSSSWPHGNGRSRPQENSSSSCHENSSSRPHENSSSRLHENSSGRPQENSSNKPHNDETPRSEKIGQHFHKAKLKIGKNMAQISNTSLLNSSQNTQLSPSISSRVGLLSDLIDDPIIGGKDQFEKNSIKLRLKRNKLSDRDAPKGSNDSGGINSSNTEFEINSFLQRQENKSCTAHIKKMLKARKVTSFREEFEESLEIQKKMNETNVVLNQAENIKQLLLASRLIKKQLEIEAKKSNKYIDNFIDEFGIN